MHNICLRLNNQEDYLEIQSKEDSDIESTISTIKREDFYWSDVTDVFLSDLEESRYSFENVLIWYKNLKNFIAVNKYFPSIEATAALQCMQSLNGYRPMPYYNDDTKYLLEYWGYNNPSCIGLLNKSGGWRFTGVKKVSYTEPKPLDFHEFKIVRIGLKENNEMSCTNFIDLKVRQFDLDEFVKIILTLPEFWRNLHLTTRKNEPKKSCDLFNRINATLSRFYNSDKFYQREEVKLEKDEIVKNITAGNHFSVYINNFASQLMFRLPGLVLPLTYREQEFTAKMEPDLNIYIKRTGDVDKTHFVSVAVPPNLLKSIFEDFSAGFSKREMDFSSYFNMEKYNAGQYVATKDSQIIFNYEKNMVQLFESLTLLDKYV